MISSALKLFCLKASHYLGEAVSQHLGVPLSAHEEREFEDGEHKVRALESVRGHDVFVLHSLYGEPQASENDKLCRLLFFIGALKDAAASRVTAIVPYLCYSRKDRKTKARDPVTTRYVAGMFEAVGCDRVVTLDVHNLAAFQNAFRCGTDHLEAQSLFIRHLVPQVGNDEVVVVSPDVGGLKRAEQFRQALSRTLQREVASAFVEKYRSGGILSGEKVVGEVRDRTALIIDDLISSGTTLARSAAACRQQGATRIWAAATHGVFAAASNHLLATPDLEQIIITNSIPPFRLTAPEVTTKLATVDLAPLLAETIRRLHQGGSLVELLAEPNPGP
ncbi:MAG TPA: ribose-phosphate pyrophosphokinase [Leptolyngbyaceae cyanobacterium M65_K2018_010]|nr:ribose-phosphate pyrophosphokinase [Leptolyngbyaceae cyanobacterium M65_K2018_010]